MPICVFHEDQTFFKSDTIFVTFKSVTFEIFGKCSESVGFDDNNNLQEDLKFFKSDTFENYKSFVPVEVQSHNNLFLQNKILVDLGTYIHKCRYWAKWDLIFFV